MDRSRDLIKWTQVCCSGSISIEQESARMNKRVQVFDECLIITDPMKTRWLQSMSESSIKDHTVTYYTLDGVKHGPCEVVLGNTTFNYTYVRGCIEGVMTEMTKTDGDRRMKSIRKYKHGELNGKSRFWTDGKETEIKYKNGVVVEDGEYKH